MTDTIVNLSAAQTAALAAGGKLIVQGAAASTSPTPPIDPPPTGTAPQLKVVFVQNGKTNPAWFQNYSYECSNSVGTPGNGNPNCISCVTTGPWGGYQPSNDNGKATDCTSGTTVTVDISAAKGKRFQMQFLQQGDLPIPLPSFQITKTVDGYERFTVPVATIMGQWANRIYKGAVQSQQGTAGDPFKVDNWGVI